MRPNNLIENLFIPYSFNGMEKDDEVKGEGNSYDFGARMLDARVGRWLSVDPLAGKYLSLSPYNFVANSPLIFIDKDGRDIYIGNGVDRKGDVKFEAGQPAPENLNQFQKDSWNALQNSINSERNPALIDLATNKSVRLDVRLGEKGASAMYIPNGQNKGELFWDPETGMFSVLVLDKNTRIVYPDDPETRMSPEESLEHELGHATNDLIKQTFKKDRKTKPDNPEMEDKEEENVIKEIDQKHMKRNNHKGIEMLGNSTPSSKDGSLPDMEQNSDGSFQLDGTKFIVKHNETMPENPEK